MTIKKHLQKSPLIPVITIHTLEDAAPLTEALLAGGLHTLEITLRTPVALEAIRYITTHYPECTVAAGTITQPDHLHQAQDAGAQFGVSPGITPLLLATAEDMNWPYLPGVFTPSDILVGLTHDLSIFKLFPAERAGGINTLKQCAQLFPHLQFCPTGGLTPHNAPEYMAQPNVISIGGSWLTPQASIQNKDWGAITALAQEASHIVPLS